MSLGKEKPLYGLLIYQAKRDEILNAKSEAHFMENAMESQKVEREELGHLRITWQLEGIATQPVKQQWGAFKEQLRKVQEHGMGIIKPQK